MKASGESPLQASQRAITGIIKVDLVDDRFDGERELRQLGTGLDAVGDGNQLHSPLLQDAH